VLTVGENEKDGTPDGASGIPTSSSSPTISTAPSATSRASPMLNPEPSVCTSRVGPFKFDDPCAVGQPLVGAPVILLHHGTFVMNSTTDEYGRVEFTGFCDIGYNAEVINRDCPSSSSTAKTTGKPSFEGSHKPSTS
jgi:hypothetical protein